MNKIILEYKDKIAELNKVIELMAERINIADAQENIDSDVWDIKGHYREKACEIIKVEREQSDV